MADTCDDIMRRVAEKAAADLAQRKAEAAARGKEPFDLAKLKAMTDPTLPEFDDTDEALQKRLEYTYYVAHPSWMTLDALAELIMLASRY